MQDFNLSGSLNIQCFDISRFERWMGILLLCLLCLLLTGCSGAKFPDLQQMLINLGRSLPPLWRLVTGLAYLFGVMFIFRGVYHLKQYGQSQTQMSSQSNLKLPLTLLLVGSALLFLPTTRSVFLTTIFAYGDPQPLSYYTVNPLWSTQATKILLQIVQLVGMIAFIRGWIYLAQSQSHNPGQHTFGKAMTHIFGGILAINIEGTRQVLQSTLGIG